MTPYFESPWVTLWLGDCREVAPTLRRGSMSLIVTDPPYGVAYRSGAVRQTDFPVMAGDDNGAWVPEALGACLRTLPTYRHVYVFGRWDLSRLPVGEAVELIWNKGGVSMGKLDATWSRTHEPITFTTYVPSTAARARNYGGLTARLRRGSVLCVPRLNARQNNRHPTEKPVALLRQLIESSSTLGETVFDPFAGSGSTLEAALLEGRKSVGIEIDERYAEVAATRIRKTEEWLAGRP